MSVKYSFEVFDCVEFGIFPVIGKSNEDNTYKLCKQFLSGLKELLQLIDEEYTKKTIYK